MRQSSEYMRNWRKKNAEHYRSYRKARYQRLKEKINAQRRASPPEVKRKNKALYKNIAMNKKARKARAVGFHTFEGWMEKVKYHGWRCFYCKILLTEGTLSQDHAIPLSRNGTNFLSNLLPACVPCNSSKKDKTVFEFLRKRAA